MRLMECKDIKLTLVPLDANAEIQYAPTTQTPVASVNQEVNSSLSTKRSVNLVKTARDYPLREP